MLKGGGEQIAAGLRRSNSLHIFGSVAGWVLANPHSHYRLWVHSWGLIRVDVRCPVSSGEGKRIKWNKLKNKIRTPPTLSDPWGPEEGSPQFNPNIPHAQLSQCWTSSAEASSEARLKSAMQQGLPGISVSPWSACDLSRDYLSISLSVTADKQLGESDTLIHQFHLRFHWQASQPLNTGGDSWPGIIIDGPFLPGWAPCQLHAVKANSRLFFRPG